MIAGFDGLERRAVDPRASAVPNRSPAMSAM
jgi:hypothetical protein